VGETTATAAGDAGGVKAAPDGDATGKGAVALPPPTSLPPAAPALTDGAAFWSGGVLQSSPVYPSKQRHTPVPGVHRPRPLHPLGHDFSSQCRPLKPGLQ